MVFITVTGTKMTPPGKACPWLSAVGEQQQQLFFSWHPPFHVLQQGRMGLGEALLWLWEGMDAAAAVPETWIMES